MHGQIKVFFSGREECMLTSGEDLLAGKGVGQGRGTGQTSTVAALFYLKLSEAPVEM